MIDMANEFPSVYRAAATFLGRQADFNRAKEELDAVLYREFATVCEFRPGDRITYAGRTGRAVILRNNETQLGLYLDKDGERYPIPEPYHLHARKVRSKPSPNAKNKREQRGY